MLILIIFNIFVVNKPYLFRKLAVGTVFDPIITYKNWSFKYKRNNLILNKNDECTCVQHYIFSVKYLIDRFYSSHSDIENVKDSDGLNFKLTHEKVFQCINNKNT